MSQGVECAISCQRCQDTAELLTPRFWAAKKRLVETTGAGQLRVTTTTYEGLNTFGFHICERCVRRFSVRDGAWQFGLFSGLLLVFIGLCVVASQTGLPIASNIFPPEGPRYMGLVVWLLICGEVILWFAVGLSGAKSGFYLFLNAKVCLGMRDSYAWSVVSRRAAINFCREPLKAEGYVLFYEKYPARRGLPQ